jgi:hypothetical protein
MVDGRVVFGGVARMHHVTRHNTAIHHILSTVPQYGGRACCV